MVVLTIEELSYVVVGLFDDLVGPFRICTCGVKFFGCAVWFNPAVAKKRSRLLLQTKADKMIPGFIQQIKHSSQLTNRIRSISRIKRYMETEMWPIKLMIH